MFTNVVVVIVCLFVCLQELIEQLKEIVVEILHTKDGSRVALQSLWHGTPKVSLSRELEGGREGGRENKRGK